MTDPENLNDDLDDSLEFPLKVGGTGTDSDREDEKGVEVPSGMLHEAVHTETHDPEIVAEVVKLLSDIRKRLGCQRESIKRIPGSMMTELAREEATQGIITACAWIEEARECLKKPVEEEEITSTWED